MILYFINFLVAILNFISVLRQSICSNMKYMYLSVLSNMLLFVSKYHLLLQYYYSTILTVLQQSVCSIMKYWSVLSIMLHLSLSTIFCYSITTVSSTSVLVVSVTATVMLSHVITWTQPDQTDYCVIVGTTLWETSASSVMQTGALYRRNGSQQELIDTLNVNVSLFSVSP